MVILMSKVTTFTFPLDKKKFSSKGAMYSHIEDTFPELLSTDVSPARLYFNLKYKKSEGRCVMTGKPTQWNETTERYERFADDKAAEAYREMFKKRMQKKYGRTHILDDPDQQKKMLDSRRISKPYIWNDNTKTMANSVLETKFLELLEGTYNFTSKTLAEPPTIYYPLDRETTAFYLPDFYIPSLNLIIEVKGYNPHYQQRDKHKEKLKEDATIKEGFDFIQVNDGNYLEFHKYFLDNVINS